MRRVLVTGANGFVGVPVCKKLIANGWRVLGCVRRPTATEDLPVEVEPIVVADIAQACSWDSVVRNVHAVVHLVARTHVISDHATDTLRECRRVNVEATRNLVRTCVDARVQRFVFMSTIKAVGEGGSDAYTEQSPLCPKDAYGISKMEAEQALSEITHQTDTEAVILRPPLVYGPRVRGNLLRLLRWTRRGLPLPLAAVNNRRSMVHVGNLADAIVTAVEHRRAAGEVFHVADDEPVSTPELLTRLFTLQNRPRRLFPCPIAILQGFGRLLGQQNEIRRLTGSLVVSNRKLRDRLGWQPRCTIGEGLHEMVMWFAQNKMRGKAPYESVRKKQATRAA